MMLETRNSVLIPVDPAGRMDVSAGGRLLRSEQAVDGRGHLLEESRRVADVDVGDLPLLVDFARLAAKDALHL